MVAKDSNRMKKVSKATSYPQRSQPNRTFFAGGGRLRRRYPAAVPRPLRLRRPLLRSLPYALLGFITLDNRVNSTVEP